MMKKIFSLSLLILSSLTAIARENVRTKTISDEIDYQVEVGNFHPILNPMDVTEGDALPEQEPIQNGDNNAPARPSTPTGERSRSRSNVTTRAPYNSPYSSPVIHHQNEEIVLPSSEEVSTMQSDFNAALGIDHVAEGNVPRDEENSDSN